MMNHEPLPLHADRDTESSAGLVRAAIFRELDRALDEVRVGLAANASVRRDGPFGRRRELEQS
ncbi:MAG TPA: hypothetical protein VFZ11_05210 [Gemmatimonadaceae bacterium]|jgi:hypothetical protein